MADPELTETRELATTLIATLQVRDQTLATAESLTGGLLAAIVTGVPGASAVLVGGVVAYATEVKQQVLGVPDEVVETDGVVSAAAAEAMASGARDLMRATYAVSTTGVAGPDEQEGKPVGRVYVGLAGPDGVRSVELSLAGTRALIREKSCAAALGELLSALG